MANTKKNTTKKVTEKTVKETVESTQDVQETVEKVKPIKLKQRNKLPKDTVVSVTNGFDGMLIYISPLTKVKYVLSEFGDQFDIELEDLRMTRNSTPDFFKNQWFLFDDKNIVYDLGVDNYYKDALDFDEFGTIFELPEKEMVDTISKLSNNQKNSIIFRAVKSIENGELDSLNKIKLLEEVLGVELIEK